MSHESIIKHIKQNTDSRMPLVHVINRKKEIFKTVMTVFSVGGINDRMLFNNLPLNDVRLISDEKVHGPL